MIKKYAFGTPFETEAVIADIPVNTGNVDYFVTSTEDGLKFRLQLQKKDAVYGLGESVRGINKRGYIYNSFCADEPNHTEATRSLYGAHNFIVIEQADRTFGAFFDCPTTVTFDVAFTKADELIISSECTNMYVYIIEGSTVYEIIRQFRGAIGMSYIPPMWAFGYTQCRWSYLSKDEIRQVVRKHRELHIPLDAVYLDIDYMERYKDFTIDQENFGDLEAFAKEMKEQNIRLVPIIDAGVKIEEGYDVYEEGVEKGYFCTDEEGKPFEACVW